MSNNGSVWSPQMEAYLASYIIQLTPCRTALRISAKRIAERMCAVFPDRRVTRNAVLGKKKRYQNWKSDARPKLL